MRKNGFEARPWDDIYWLFCFSENEMVVCRLLVTENLKLLKSYLRERT